MSVHKPDSVKPWRIYVHGRGTDDESIAVRRVAQDWKPVDVVPVAEAERLRAELREVKSLLPAVRSNLTGIKDAVARALDAM